MGRYHVNISPIFDSASVQNNSNAVSFYNQGNTIAVVNGLRILPLSGWTPFEPVQGDSDETNYIITFDATGVASPINNLLYIRKDYK